MVEKVEAAVNPYPVLRDRDVVLRIDGPMTFLWNLDAYFVLQQMCQPLQRRRDRCLCAASHSTFISSDLDVCQTLRVGAGGQAVEEPERAREGILGDSQLMRTIFGDSGQQAVIASRGCQDSPTCP